MKGKNGTKKEDKLTRFGVFVEADSCLKKARLCLCV